MKSPLSSEPLCFCPCEVQPTHIQPSFSLRSIPYTKYIPALSWALVVVGSSFCLYLHFWCFCLLPPPGTGPVFPASGYSLSTPLVVGLAACGTLCIRHQQMVTWEHRFCTHPLSPCALGIILLGRHLPGLLADSSALPYFVPFARSSRLVEVTSALSTTRAY